MSLVKWIGDCKKLPNRFWGFLRSAHGWTKRQSWVLPLLILVGTVVSVFVLLISYQSLRLQRHVWNAEQEDRTWREETLKRDSRLSGKALVYAREARGHMATIRKITQLLATKKRPKELIDANQKEFAYYVFHAIKCTNVVDSCFVRMTTPTLDDVALWYSLKDELLKLANNEGNVLEQMGIDFHAIFDEQFQRALSTPEAGEFFTMAPQTTYELVGPLAEALKKAE